MFRPDPESSYLMPVHFGGSKFDPHFIITQKATGLAISYETDRQMLEAYIPEVFELLEPQITVAYNMFTEINWMHGGAYNLVDVSVPVRFNGKKDSLTGSYPLVTWENKTAPILGGREQTGIPKIFCDIEDLRVLGPACHGAASSGGSTFLYMDFEQTGRIEGPGLDAARAGFKSMNTIGWRYIPKVGKPGAELSQFILYPQGVDIDTAFTGKGSIRWIEQGPMQYGYQFWVANQVAALPVKKITNAVLVHGSARLHANGARVLE
ncbi:MAG: acetoacetate decarboxylase family protein [Methanomicrobiales archaeon]|nr:acetoacetate decarboxylase family protein [Methanomicrobiales archaeon]